MEDAVTGTDLHVSSWLAAAPAWGTVSGLVVGLLDWSAAGVPGHLPLWPTIGSWLLYMVTDGLVGLALGSAAGLVLAGWRWLDSRTASGTLPSTGVGFLVCLGLVLPIAWAAERGLGSWIHSERYLTLARFLVPTLGVLVAVAGTPSVAASLVWMTRRLPRWAPWVLAAALGGPALTLGSLRVWHLVAPLPPGLTWYPLVFLAAMVLGPARFARSGGPRITPWWPMVAAPLLLALVAWISESPGPRLVLARSHGWTPAVIAGLRKATDFDHDGVSGLFGGGDCRPWDPSIHPGALDVPGNGVDEDCWGGDASPGEGASSRPVRVAPPDGWPRPRNLLLVTVDALRADHLGLYGYHRATSPNLDALGERAIVFQQFYSPSPCTRWALPMIMVSRYPADIPWDRSTWPHRVPRSETTMAELLQRAGYQTATPWHMRGTFGLDQGFGRWDTTLAKQRKDRAPDLTAKGIELLDELAARRFFLWLHYYDPHAPYRHNRVPGLPKFGDRPVDRYDEEIALADHGIGELLKHLDALGLTDDTIVVITADHGEAFGEHGGHHHYCQLYQEMIRIPLIVRVPGLGPARISAPSSLVDLAPTILDLLGVDDAGAHGQWQGASLVPYLFPDTYPGLARALTPVFASLAFFPKDGCRARAVILGNLKLIHDPVAGVTELFDLATDPLERHDLSGAREADVDRLMGLLLPWMAAHSPEGRRG